MKTNRILLVLALLGVALASAPTVAQSPPPQKTRITRLDDLPRHTYQLTMKVSELLANDEAFPAFAADVRRDIEGDLLKYEIVDVATLKRLYQTLARLDLLEGRDDQALQWTERIRDLETKRAEKLTTGLVSGAIIAARRAAGDDPQKLREAFRAHLAAQIADLPWDIVEDVMVQTKGQMEIMNENLLIGTVSAQLDPVVEKSGEVSDELARQIVSMRMLLRTLMPFKDDVVSVIGEAIERNRVARADIWPQREVALDADTKAQPVVVAIWDSGVDTAVFDGLLVTERGEGDDIDVAGIAFDLEGRRSDGLLPPLGDAAGRIGQIMNHMKGFLDVRAGVDSPEAQRLRTLLGELKPDEVQALLEDLSLCGNYTHGTHVAGIAAAGNPFIRILPARLTFDHRMTPTLPTVERARRMAEVYRETVEYFTLKGVRVANLSWGGGLKNVESALEKNAAGGDAAERAALAREIFEIEKAGLREALESVPDILFIVAAGNSDNDVEFEEMIPSSFDLPNVLVVGAVNRAGLPTGFTSFGRTVRVYANGFEVESYVPGGERLKLSGTSMAAPQVTNLAAKLLAVEPDLTPAGVIERILAATDASPTDRPLRLIHPHRAMKAEQGNEE